MFASIHFTWHQVHGCVLRNEVILKVSNVVSRALLFAGMFQFVRCRQRQEKQTELKVENADFTARKVPISHDLASLSCLVVSFACKLEYATATAPKCNHWHSDPSLLPLSTMPSGKASARREYFFIDGERYSLDIMQMLSTGDTNKSISLAQVERFWAMQKQWGRGMAAMVSNKRKTLEYALDVLLFDGDARSSMEQEVGKVQTAAGKNYWQYIPQQLALENPGTLAQAKLLWETPNLWHTHVASIKRHTVEYAINAWNWEADALSFLQSKISEAKEDLGKKDDAANEVHAPSPARTSNKPTRRALCDRCLQHMGLRGRHKPGSRHCAWYNEVERCFPGRFIWDEHQQEWNEMPGDWDACDTEVADEQVVESALELLGLPRNHDAEMLHRCYRKRALRCHPDKTGEPDDAFRRLKDAFDLLKTLCEEHELPSAPTVLLALKAPRRRWKLGALEGILNKRPTVEQ